MRATALALLVSATALTGASAGELRLRHTDDTAGTKSEATILQEMIVTNNALDGPVAFNDTIFHLRGTIGHERDVAIGRVGLNAVVEVHEFRDIAFESDRAASVTASFAREFSDRLALRTSLGYAVEDQGDHLDLGPVIIGTRTFSRTLAGEVELVGKLSERTGFGVQLSASHEDVDDARLEAGLPDLRLTPDSRRLGAGLVLRHAFGSATARLVARADVLDSPEEGASLIGSRALKLAVGLETADLRGFRLDAEIGAVHLGDDFDLTGRVYPVYALSAARTLPGGIEASLTLRGFIDTRDSDDPLGSYVRRAEHELSKALPHRLTASAGIFAELRDNLAIGNEEEAAGVYLALAYDPTDRHAFLFRLDFSERRRTLFDVTECTVSGTFGLRIKL